MTYSSPSIHFVLKLKHVQWKYHSSVSLYKPEDSTALLGNMTLCRIYRLVRWFLAEVISFICFYFHSLKHALGFGQMPLGFSSTPKDEWLEVLGFKKEENTECKWYLNKLDFYTRWRERRPVVLNKRKTRNLSHL